MSFYLASLFCRLQTFVFALLFYGIFLLVDDVISTGESLHALETLVEKTGANIVGRASVLAEGDAKDRDDIIFLSELPLFFK